MQKCNQNNLNKNRKEIIEIPSDMFDQWERIPGSTDKEKILLAILRYHHV